MRNFFFTVLMLLVATIGVAQTPINFETDGRGADWTWTVTEDGTNPSLTVMDNPFKTGINTSNKVAKFVATQGGAVWALCYSDNLGNTTITTENCIVKIWVYKTVISEVGLKFEIPNGISKEINVPNTKINEWEEITFDFTSVIGLTYSTIVIIPERSARTADNVVYFDNITFTAGTVIEPVELKTIDFEAAGVGSDWSWTVGENGTDPALEIIENPYKTGINTTTKVAKFTALQAGKEWALFFSSSIGAFKFDEKNSIVKIMVYKTVISDVALKFEGGSPAKEIKVANTKINEWEELIFDFSGVKGNTYDKIVITPDFAVRTADNVILIDNISFNAAGAVPPNELKTVDFEVAGVGADWAWVVDKNGTNPALEAVDNPFKTGINTTNKVAKFTAQQAGEQWALFHSNNIGTFVFDEKNSFVKIMVYKTVLSDVGIKFEGSSDAKEIKVANTKINEWEELTFDFSGVKGNSYNRIVIIPDFAARTTDNVVYIDNISFNAATVPVNELKTINFEVGGVGADWAWVVDANDDDPDLTTVANPSKTGINTSDKVALFTAKDAGMDWALFHSGNIGAFIFDDNNYIVKIMVYKTVLSDIGLKFEGSSVAKEIKVANTKINEWEEITFDFSSVKGNSYNKIVIIPDFAARTTDNVIYIDNISFQGAVAPKSNDATLSDLKVNGTTISGFNAATTVYSFELSAGTTAIPTVVATKNHANAAITSITYPTSLPGAVSVLVTAEDGTTKTYTINVSQQANTSISETGENTLQVYPNPVFNELTISNISSKSTLSIFDINGKMLQTKVATTTSEKIDVSNLHDGIYFVRIANDKTVVTRKFIKQ